MRIVAVCPNWIGDAVMATPALAAARAAPGVEHLAVVCRPYVAPVFQSAPYVDQIIHWDAPGAPALRVAAAIVRRQSFDQALLLTNSFRSALMVRLARVPQRIGYSRDFRGLLLTRRLRPPRTAGRFRPSPMLNYYHELVRHLGVAQLPTRMRLYADEAESNAAQALFDSLKLSPGRVLILAPGAAFGAAKCWPASRFAQVARRSLDELGLPSLLLCSPGERPVAERIAEESHGAAILPRQSLPLGTVKAVISRAAAMVTNDSGLRHFAAAYDLPVVTIFGPTHIAWTETWFPREVKLQAQVDCGPCQQKVCPQGHLKCMELVTVEAVMEALADLLERHAT